MFSGKFSQKYFFKTLFFILFLMKNEEKMFAQRTMEIKIPDLEIFANRVERGDGDTYGLGDWRCSVKLRLVGSTLFLDGKITFWEKANDFTTISGEIHQQIDVPELEKCSFCAVSIENLNGSANGENFGARGFRWFDGRGIIRRAKIQTDLFGEDVGQIGGIVQFLPIRAVIRCDYALVDFEF
jgi:hypothetical protein